jgi:hypothetical protein
MDEQPTTEELLEAFDKVVKALKENSQMDDECRKVLYDNLWDLYEDCEK